MKKTIGQAFAFVGTVIGAGFATGKEILLFFGNSSFISIFIAGFLLSLFCYCFLRLGSIYGNIFFAFGKFKLIVKIFIIIANICVFCATLAGAEEVIFNIFHFHGGGIITAIITLIIVFFGVNAIKIVNLVIVPAIIVIITIIFFKDSQYDLNGKISFILPFCYASMNLSTGGFFIGKNAVGFTKKDCLTCSAISGLILTILMFFIYCIVKNVDSSMPFIAKSVVLGFGIIANVVLYLAMLTTLIGTLDVSALNNKYFAILITAIGLLVSTFGFSNIVNSLYPIMGAVGGVITVSSVVILILNPRLSRCYNRLSL